MMKPSPPRNHLVLRTILLVSTLVLLSAGTALLVTRWLQPSMWKHDQPNGHQWLSRELHLTEEEMAKIDAFDLDYRRERQKLQKQFQKRIATLADILHRTNAYGPEVTEAVHSIHIVHGQLQQLAIEHYYDMLRVLPPDKQTKLRDLAIEALSQPQ